MGRDDSRSSSPWRADLDRDGLQAEFERKLNRQRCDEGIKRAKERGTVFGRKPVLDAGERRKIVERHADGETIAVLARDYGCDEVTIWRALHGQ